MVLPSRTPPEPAEIVRSLDPDWAERLGAEAARYERLERRSGLRRAGACLLAAIAVVGLGLLGFREETDTRLAPVKDVRGPGWVTVTLSRTHEDGHGHGHVHASGAPAPDGRP